MKEAHSARETWKAFKAGDREALGTIFKMYYPLLHHYGLKISHNEILTEDLLQDFFLYLYEHRESLKDLDSLKAYLFASFRRMLLRRLKQNRKQEHYLSSDFLDSKEYIQFSIEELLISNENKSTWKKTLSKTLNKLPKRQREVVYLRYYNEMSLVEIAEVMNITYQGVSNTLYKAFKSLRKNTSLVKIKDLVIVILIFGVQLI